MTRARLVVAADGADANAVCFACGELIARFTSGQGVRSGPLGPAMHLSGKLVPRPEPLDGLPRFGPVLGRSGARHARTYARRIEEELDGSRIATTANVLGSRLTPTRVYVNCPACDRGMVVEPPDLRSLAAKARRAARERRATVAGE